MSRGILAGHLSLVAVQFCFGLFPVFGKWALAPGGFSPFALAFWRMTFGALALCTLALAVHGRRFWPGKRELPALFAAALLGVVSNQALYLSGLARSTAVNAGLVMCLIPVFTVAIALAAKQERFSPARAAGVLLALVGAVAWLALEQRELVRAQGFGNALMVLNALVYAAYLVLSKPLLGRNPPLVVLAWVFLFSALCAPVFAIGQDLWPSGAPTRVWTSFAYALIFPTVLSYLLNLFAIARLRASTAAVYIYVQPLITASAGALLLDEAITPAVLVAGALVFAGIALASRERARPIETLRPELP